MNPLQSYVDAIKAELGDDGLTALADDALRLGVDIRDRMDNGDDASSVADDLLGRWLDSQGVE